MIDVRALTDTFVTTVPTISAAALGTDDAQLVTAAWLKVEHGWQPPSKQAPTDTTDLWGWLWLGSQWESEELAVGAGLNEYRMGDVFEQLRVHHILLPDGRVQPWAENIIRAALIQKWPVLAPQRRPANDPRQSEPATHRHEEPRGGDDHGGAGGGGA